jgi:CRP/FNR family transcriptional regulator, cyclic AMP receptor protein
MMELSEGLGKTIPFSVLTKKELELLAEDATEIEVSEGESLFGPGSPSDAIYFVLDGGIKLTRNKSDQTRLVLEFFGPGELVLEEGILSDSAHKAEARPVGGARVSKISFKVLRKLLDSNSKFSQACMEMLSGRLFDYRERIESLVFKDVEARLAGALLALARKFGKRDPKGTLINVKITHQDISDYIAASRETVSLCLGQFKRKRLIQTQVRWLIIPDLKALRKIAEA